MSNETDKLSLRISVAIQGGSWDKSAIVKHARTTVDGRDRRGFSAVEVLIVVMIIGMLAAIAIPTMMRSRQSAQVARMANDLAVAANAFDMYRMEHSAYPPDNVAGAIPQGMEEYLTRFWQEETPLGGRWGWCTDRFSVKACVSVYLGGRWREDAWLEVDKRIDDGKLDTGRLRRRPGGYLYVVEF